MASAHPAQPATMIQPALPRDNCAAVYFRLLKNSVKEAKQQAANAAYYVKVMERVLERGSKYPAAEKKRLKGANPPTLNHDPSPVHLCVVGLA